MSTSITATQPPKPVGSHQRGFINRLTTGTGAFNIIGHRRTYYIVSLVIVVIAIALMIVRGFNFGIEFAGGTKLQFPASAVTTVEAVGKAVETSTGQEPTVQTVGAGAAASVQVRTSTLAPDQVVAAKQAIATAFGISVDDVSESAVSETWGGDISQRAVIALIVFLVVVSIFLWLRYERRVAVGALAAVSHDLILTAGIYSLVGFEVTPATVIGLLAILGFSLYDTVVVYDKVQENTKGLTSLLRRNYEEAANLAVNQTLMRSINTTVIALLPVAGLLVAGVAILGSGTLKDLALVQLVGMIVSGYSSVFLAVPIAVDLRLRDSIIRSHTARVAARRKTEGLIVDADGDPIGRRAGFAAPVRAGTHDGTGEGDSAAGTARKAGSRPVESRPVGSTPVGSTPAGSTPVGSAPLGSAPLGSKPRPGVKPQQRPTGRPVRPAGKSGRPTGKRPR